MSSKTSKKGDMKEKLIEKDKNKKKSNLIQDEEDGSDDSSDEEEVKQDINTTKDKSADSKLRQSVSLPKKEDLVAKKKEEDEKNKKTYSLWDFAKFTLPFLWKGGLMIKLQTILTFILLFVSKGLNVTHPLILKYAIDSIQECLDDKTCPNSDRVYFLVAMYCVVRFAADFVNNIREIPFANVSASAEIYIAHIVYTHVQN